MELKRSESDLEFRPATEADYAFLFDLHRQTFRLYVEQTWGWDEAVQAEIVRREFAGSSFRIIRYQGKDIGCICIEDHGDHLFLDHIAILPDYQNRGIGTRLVHDL